MAKKMEALIRSGDLTDELELKTAKTNLKALQTYEYQNQLRQHVI